MRVSRLYQDCQLQSGAEITLDAQASHYLTHVLRLPVGAFLHLFDGHGNEFCAQISSAAKKAVVVCCQDAVATIAESPCAVHLGQVIARGEKMDLILQKAVELGVQEITPLFSERCGVKLNAERLQKRQQHWLGVIISACEQSGRATLPHLHQAQPLAQWQQQQSGCRFVLSPHVQAATLPQQAEQITLAIGPEGGLTDREVNDLIDNGFQALKLGPRILRTETAGLACLAILQARYGDLA